RHGAAELAAAVVDGVALSGWHVLDAAERATGTIAGEVQLGGRGIDHPAWTRARAGALHRPLVLHAEQNLAAWGAAQLAATAAGHPLPSAGEREARRIHDPDPSTAPRWDDRRHAYL